ncbi:ribonuclease 7-like [Macrotis lagotis]|uniref:ribonuclease 7-like n=1 Tax=Macrotis lagotis TaxID=92651 RepID=UPI003D6843ED
MATFQLMLLGLWVTMFLVIAATPPGLTEAKWFEVQHMRKSKISTTNDDKYCTDEMKLINSHISHCKNFNTFLYSSDQNKINEVCFTPKIMCKNSEKNCHKSSSKISITKCMFISGSNPNCLYHGTSEMAYFVIACEPTSSKESKSKLLPIHLETTIKD